MKELNTIQTKLNAPKNQRNNFGGYNYRSCEDILEALKPLLKETGCTVTISDEIVEIGGRIYVKATATITNESGESVSTTAYAREEEAKKGMDASQITGATSSYARKYALNGLFCIDDNKDADATNTHGKEEAKPAPKTTAKKVAAPQIEVHPVYAQEEQDYLKSITAETEEQAVALAEGAKDSKELTAVWYANKDKFGINPRFVMAISKNPHNPKKRG